MPGPFSRTKSSMICRSVMPSASMRAIFSLAGLEKPHSSMLQLATESLQPHWHWRRLPSTARSSEGFSEAVWASDRTASARAAKTSRSRRDHGELKLAGGSACPTLVAWRLFLKLCMRGDHAHHCGAGILHFDFAGDQADEGAADEHEAADPDPRYQREDVGLNDGAQVVVGHAAEVEVEVLIGAHADADFGSALLAGQVETLFRFELAEEFAVLRDVHGGAVPLVDGGVALLEVNHLQLVSAHLHGVADIQFLGFGLVEGVAGEADEHEDDAHVDQVSAVAAGVAVGELDNGACQVHGILDRDGVRAFVKLDKDGERHEEAEAEGDEGVGVAHAGGEEPDDQHQRRDAGPLEVAAETIGGSLGAGEKRADAGEEEQEEADGDAEAVVPIGIERDLV